MRLITLVELLDEISAYFYGCYRNAARGSEAEKMFHDWMCAIDDAKKEILRDETD